MLTLLRIRARQLAADERGYAMVTVVGLIALLTVIAFGGYFIAQQSLHDSQLVKKESLAFQAANAGLDGAVADIQLAYVSGHFPMTFTKSDLGSGSATVTVSQTAGVTGEYTVTSVGTGPDGATETVKVRIYMLDLYGMNIAYGSGFNQGGSSGKFNGNASIYGPFYTMDDLTQGDNLGQGNAGGFGWGPIFIRNGTLDVKSGYLVNVKVLYVDPKVTAPRIVDTDETRIVRAVPALTMPEVDAAYLESRYAKAELESSDNIQGDPDVRPNTNSEVGTVGDPSTYGGTRCIAGTGPYKIVDNDTSVNRSNGLLTIGSTSFGRPGDAVTPGDDFVYDASTSTLTVWGTVFIDGPLTINRAVNYLGNGTLVCNGDVKLQGDFLPQGGLTVGKGGDGVDYPNQSFDPDRIIGISTPNTISLDNSSGGNAMNPDGAPTHAGAFFASDKIVINAKVLLCGSLISDGIDVSGNNNMDLRTSANLGEYVPRSMPGYGLLFQSIGGWSRR